MARRKRIPQVAKPTLRQRLIELGKDLLILLLTCSAVFLAFQLPVSPQLGLLSPSGGETSQTAGHRGEDAVTPYAVALRSPMGLYGVSYDEAAVERVFSQLSPLLGRALAGAGAPETITRRAWEERLEGLGAYCAFQGSPSLSALQTLLGQGEGTLTGSAQSILLSLDGGELSLCWRQGDRFYRAPVEGDWAEQLEFLLAQFSPNGAAFAYALAREDGAYDRLDPDVLVSMTTPQPQLCTVTSPDFTGDTAALETLLAALGFQSGVNSAYQAAGDLAINENGDRLRVSTDGKVVFHAGGDSRYPVSSQGEEATAGEALQAAWELLGQAAAPWQREGSFVLTGCEESEEGWLFTFQGRLAGLPVLTGEEGWCARFLVDGREIKSFTLLLHSYVFAGEGPLIPPERLAAAALESLPEATGSLVLCYTDHAGTLTAGWMALE